MLTSVPVIDLNDFFDADKKSAFIKHLAMPSNILALCASRDTVSTDITHPAYRPHRAFCASGETDQYVIHGERDSAAIRLSLRSLQKVRTSDLKEFWHVGRSVKGSSAP